MAKPTRADRRHEVRRVLGERDTLLAFAGARIDQIDDGGVRAREPCDGERGPVWRERERRNAGLWKPKRLTQRTPAGCVIDSDRVLLASHGNELPVRVDGDRPQLPPGESGSAPSRAGLRCSTVSRLLRVAADSSSSIPARASSRAFSRLSAVTASAPRRWASAATAASRASPRWSRASRPAAIATMRATAAPASSNRMAAIYPPVALRLALTHKTAVLQEVLLEPVELTTALRRPVQGGRKSRAAV